MARFLHQGWKQAFDEQKVAVPTNAALLDDEALRQAFGVLNQVCPTKDSRVSANAMYRKDLVALLACVPMGSFQGALLASALAILWCTIMRGVDTIRLTWADIDINKGTVQVLNTKAGVRHKMCTREMDPDLRRVLVLYHAAWCRQYGSPPKQRDLLFQSLYGRQESVFERERGARSKLVGRLNTLAQRAGYPPNYFSAHSVSHGSLTTTVLEAVIKQQSVADTLDVETIISTRWSAGSKAARIYINDLVGRLYQRLQRRSKNHKNQLRDFRRMSRDELHEDVKLGVAHRYSTTRSAVEHTEIDNTVRLLARSLKVQLRAKDPRANRLAVAKAILRSVQRLPQAWRSLVNDVRLKIDEWSKADSEVGPTTAAKHLASMMEELILQGWLSVRRRSRVPTLTWPPSAPWVQEYFMLPTRVQVPKERHCGEYVKCPTVVIDLTSDASKRIASLLGFDMKSYIKKLKYCRHQVRTRDGEVLFTPKKYRGSSTLSAPAIATAAQSAVVVDAALRRPSARPAPTIVPVSCRSCSPALALISSAAEYSRGAIKGTWGAPDHSTRLYLAHCAWWSR